MILSLNVSLIHKFCKRGLRKKFVPKKKLYINSKMATISLRFGFVFVKSNCFLWKFQFEITPWVSIKIVIYLWKHFDLVNYQILLFCLICVSDSNVYLENYCVLSKFEIVMSKYDCDFLSYCLLVKRLDCMFTFIFIQSINYFLTICETIQHLNFYWINYSRNMKIYISPSWKGVNFNWFI